MDEEGIFVYLQKTVCACAEAFAGKEDNDWGNGSRANVSCSAYRDVDKGYLNRSNRVVQFGSH